MSLPLLTPVRVAWLRALADGRERPWGELPLARTEGKRKPCLATRLSWEPMVGAGWLTTRFGPVPGKRFTTDKLFTITPAGRLVLAQLEIDHAEHQRRTRETAHRLANRERCPRRR